MGAMALFGEKYGDIVRVVDMGDGYSVEFCGGTHLDNTAKVGSLRIVSEFSVASGVRRIEAITGQETLKFMENNTRLLMTLSERLKAKPEELLTRAEARTSEIRELRSELEKFRGREMLSNAESFLASSKKVGPLHVFTGVVPVDTPDNLRKIGDFLRDKDESIVAVLAAVHDGKITFHSVCGKAAVAAGVQRGRYHPLCHRHLRRQGRRQAGFRHGRRRRYAQARRRSRYRGRFRRRKAELNFSKAAALRRLLPIM